MQIRTYVRTYSYSRLHLYVYVLVEVVAVAVALSTRVFAFECQWPGVALAATSSYAIGRQMANSSFAALRIRFSVGACSVSPQRNDASVATTTLATFHPRGRHEYVRRPRRLHSPLRLAESRGWLAATTGCRREPAAVVVRTRAAAEADRRHWGWAALPLVDGGCRRRATAENDRECDDDEDDDESALAAQ